MAVDIGWHVGVDDPNTATVWDVVAGLSRDQIDLCIQPGGAWFALFESGELQVWSHHEDGADSSEPVMSGVIDLSHPWEARVSLDGSQMVMPVWWDAFDFELPEPPPEVSNEDRAEWETATLLDIQQTLPGVNVGKVWNPLPEGVQWLLLDALLITPRDDRGVPITSLDGLPGEIIQRYYMDIPRTLT